MRIDHSTHAHANTPAARSDCRAMLRNVIADSNAISTAEFLELIHDDELSEVKGTMITPAGTVRAGSIVSITARWDGSTMYAQISGFGTKNGRDVVDYCNPDDSMSWAYAADVAKIHQY